MSDAVDISDLPVPGAATDISDLPVPPKEAAAPTAPQYHSGVNWEINPGDISRPLGYLKDAVTGAAGAARDVIGNIPGQMTAALAREFSRLAPGVDPNDVRNAILRATTTHSDNPTAQDIEGTGALPFRAAGQAYDKGVSMLPDALQPAAKGLGEVGSDVMALAPGAGAVRAGIESLASKPEQTIAQSPADVAKEAGYTGLKTKADMRGTPGAQNITDTLINQDAGLKAGQVPTLGTLENARTVGPKKVYDAVQSSLPEKLTQDDVLQQAIRGLQDSTSQLPKTEGVEDLKQTMLGQPDMTRQQLFANISDARARSSQYLASEEPKNIAVGAAYRQLANAYEDFAARSLPKDAPVTVDDFRDARTAFAKNYDAQYALRGEHYDPLVYGRIAQHDANLLTGNSAIVAHVVNGLPGAGITGSIMHGAAPYVVGGTLGTAAGHMLGSPEIGAVLGTVGGPFVQNAARNFATRGDPEAAAGAATNPALSQFQRDYEMPAWWGRDPPVDLRPGAPTPLTASDPSAPPRAAPSAGPSLADVLSGNLSLGEHQPPGLTASAPAYTHQQMPDFAPSEAERLSQGLSLAGDHGASLSATNPMDYARVISSQVPEGIMARTPNTASKLAELQHRYGLTLEEQRAPELAERSARQDLENQAGFAAGGYLSIMRHWAQHR